MGALVGPGTYNSQKSYWKITRSPWPVKIVPISGLSIINAQGYMMFGN